MFICPYCRRGLPKYYQVTSGHQRVPVICEDCHEEKRDMYRKWRKPPPPKPPKGITPRQREAWELTHVHGMSQEDAAAIMGISQQAVSRLLVRVGL